MWVHSQLYSEAKEKQKKKQYVLHYVPLLAGVSQKSVNGWNGVYTQAAAAAATTAAALPLSSEEICHTIFPLFNFFFISSQCEHSYTCTDYYYYFYVLPHFPSTPLRAKWKKKKGKRMLKRLLCLLTPSPFLLLQSSLTPLAFSLSLRTPLLHLVAVFAFRAFVVCVAVIAFSLSFSLVVWF